MNKEPAPAPSLLWKEQGSQGNNQTSKNVTLAQVIVEQAKQKPEGKNEPAKRPE